MKDTMTADISEHNPVVTDEYSRWHKFSRWLIIRANDGTWKDQHWAQNLAWIYANFRTHKLIGFITYFVFELNWQDAVNTYKAQLGTTHRPRMAGMIDVERWGNRIVGDHSQALNATYAQVWQWFNSLRPAWQRKVYGLAAWFRRQDRKRVIAYGNQGDLDNIWPRSKRPKGLRIILANYSTNPDYPGKIGHQFSSTYPCPPFGHCDMNSFDGISPRALARKLGMRTLTRHL